MRISSTTQHQALLNTVDVQAPHSTKRCSTLVMSTTRARSCYAHVKHHTALIIAQHWRCPSTTQHQALLNTGDVNHAHARLLCICQAPHSTNHCSTLAMSKHHTAPSIAQHWRYQPRARKVAMHMSSTTQHE